MNWFCKLSLALTLITWTGSHREAVGQQSSAQIEISPVICLHPDNPRWFRWRGKSTVLITSAEHYGAVLNAEFDFPRYLGAMHDDGMNYTRIFSGSYVEPQGAFGITHNTLAPAPGQFLAPWARSDQPGYAGGGNKFDLDRFNPEYLKRLKAFIAEAGEQDIVVELTLFCSTYSDQQWAVHPLNPNNNIQSYDVPDWKKLNTIETPPSILETQRRLTQWLVRELNEFDNLFFEIQNEPWADNYSQGDYINPYLAGTKNWANSVQITSEISISWQREIASAITSAERNLPHQHLIGQNVANFQLALRDEDLVPEASVINFHYAYPQAVDWNRGLPRVIGYDETGFAGSKDSTYRREAWNFVLSGGALFNSLDYSFSVGHETGDLEQNEAPGGGSQQLRDQLGILSDFLNGFELHRMNPDDETIVRASGVSAHCLSELGQQYAIYVQGRSPSKLDLSLPSGQYTVEWTNVKTGDISRAESLVASSNAVELPIPAFEDGIALSIRRQTSPSP